VGRCAISWIAAAVVASAVIGAGSSYLAGQSASDAASSAADTSLQGTTASIAAQERMFNKSTELQEPFRQAGLAMLPGAQAAGQAGYAQIPGLVNEAFDTNSAGLSIGGQWQLEQAQRQNANALSARGLTNSGAGLELNRRTGESVAASDYTDSWNRKLQAENLSIGVSPLGQGASTASTMGSQATNTGANIGNTYSTGYNTAGQYGLQGGLAQGQMYQNMGGLGMGMMSGALKQYGYSQGYGQGVGTLDGGLSANFYAEGGRPEPGAPAIVGEQGPEVFVPDSPGTILPNPATVAAKSKPGAGLNRERPEAPNKTDWLESEAIQGEEIKHAILIIDQHINMEGPSLEYLEKRDKLQKMLASSVQRVEKGTEPKRAAGGKK
jgi:hypothetical protein